MATPAEIEAILNGPSLVPPAGLMPNFVNPSNLNTLSIVTLTVFLSLALIAFSMRIYTKLLILHNFAKEDYCLLLGVIFLIVYTSIAFKDMAAGAGVHQWNIQVKNIKAVIYYLYIAEIIYSFCVIFIRISIILQYLRIFHQARRATFMYIGCWATLSVLVVFYIAIIFLTVFACNPRDKLWNPLILTGHCLNSLKVNSIGGGFNVVIDFVILLLPQFEIWKLHTTPKKRAAVSAVFLIAFCACLASALRFYYSIKVENTKDLSYHIIFEGIGGMAENSIGILCCCLPVLPRFYQVVISPKIQYLSNSSFWTKTRSKSVGISKNIRTLSTLSTKGSKFDDTTKGSRSVPSRLQGTSEDLEGTELHALRTAESDAPSGVGGHSFLDLNDSNQGIRMTHEITVEGSLAQDMSLDLEGRRNMGW